MAGREPESAKVRGVHVSLPRMGLTSTESLGRAKSTEANVRGTAAGLASWRSRAHDCKMDVPVGTVTREPTEVALSEIGGAAEAALKLRIHDSSRIEWSVSVPLPADRRLSYEIEARLEVPATAASRHAPWDQLQVLS